jgi:hypothetical protein
LRRIVTRALLSTFSIALITTACLQAAQGPAPAARSGAPRVAETVTAPAQHLGRPVAGDFTLADWNGAGAVHLFGFRLQYRGWSQNTFSLLFRALLFEKRP